MLIVGYGDVGTRVAQRLSRQVRVMALTRQSPHVAPAAAGPQRPPQALAVQKLQGDLDHPASLRRLAGVATHVLHLAPPPASGPDDPRTAALLQALARRTLPQALVYGSTSGVYGDCGGRLVAETSALQPTTARAQRTRPRRPQRGSFST